MPEFDLLNLRPMLDEIAAAPAIVDPSALWRHYGEKNCAQLEASGFGVFKRTVNRDYFQFIAADPHHDQFKAVLRRWLERPSAAPLRARLAGPFPSDAPLALPPQVLARTYAFYVAALWEFARSRDSTGMAEHLEEPSLGNPIVVCHRGRVISEDLCSSLLELSAIAEGLGRAAAPRRHRHRARERLRPPRLGAARGSPGRAGRARRHPARAGRRRALPHPPVPPAARVPLPALRP